MTYKFDDQIRLNGSKLLVIIFVTAILFSLAPLLNVAHAALPMCGSGGGCNPGTCPLGQSCQPITGTTGCGASQNMPHLKCQSSAAITISPNPVTVGSSATITATCALGTDACSIDSPLGTHLCRHAGSCTYDTPTTLSPGTYIYYANDITAGSYIEGVLTVAGAPSESLTITYDPTTGDSPNFVGFAAQCVGSSCGSSTYIYDEGPGGTCLSGKPGFANICNYGDIATMKIPCIDSSSSASATGTTSYTISNPTAGSVTQTICAVTLTSGSPATTSTSLTINPAGYVNTGGGVGSANGVVGAICNVYYIVNTIVFILALTLMILGGALYAGAQILPGQSRGQVQGYAMGLIFGGVVGAIIAVLAPYILSIVYGNSVASILSICAP